MNYFAYNLIDLNDFEAEMGEIWWLEERCKKRDALGGYDGIEQFLPSPARCNNACSCLVSTAGALCRRS